MKEIISTSSHSQRMPIQTSKEFLVNTDTMDRQWFSSVAGFTNNNFIVTWISDHRILKYGVLEQEGDINIKGQLFNADGEKLNSEFFVQNSTSVCAWVVFSSCFPTPIPRAAVNVGDPVVSVFKNGNFVVVWKENTNDIFSFTLPVIYNAVVGQIFDSLGNKINNQFIVSQFGYEARDIDPDQIPEVAVVTKSNDNFVVAWDEYTGSTNFPFKYEIKAQQFDAFGNAVSAAFVVNSRTLDNSGFKSVSMSVMNNDNFIITWRDITWGDGGLQFGHGQLFNATGNKINGDFDLDFADVDVAVLDDDNFVIVGGKDGHIFGQFFNDTAFKVGNEFLVSSHASSRISVTALEDKFLVVWDSIGDSDKDEFSGGIFGQFISNNAVRIGTETLINNYIYHAQSNPKVIEQANGNYVFTWTSYAEDDDDDGIVGKITSPILSVENFASTRVYTEDQLLFINDMSIYAIYNPNQATFTLTLSNNNAGSISTLLTSPEATANFDTTLGQWQAVGTLDGINTLLSGLSYTPTLYYYADFTIDVSIVDGISPDLSGTIIMQGIHVNHSPTVQNIISPQTLSVGITFTYSIPADTFFDIDGDVLVYQINLEGGGSLPNWLQFDAQTQTLSTVDSAEYSEVGITRLMVSVEDVEMATAQTRLDLNILPSLFATNTNTIMTYTEEQIFDFSPDIIITTGTTDVAISLSLLDPKAGVLTTETIGSTTSSYDRQKVEWIAAGPTTEVNQLLSQVQFIPSPLYFKDFLITLTITDGYNNDLTGQMAMQGIHINHAPITVKLIPEPDNIIKGERFDFVVPSDIFFDEDGDVLSYQSYETGSTSLPNWLSFDNQTLTYSGKPKQVEFIPIELVATDPYNVSTRSGFLLDVLASPNISTSSSGAVSPGLIAGTVIGPLAGVGCCCLAAAAAGVGFWQQYRMRQFRREREQQNPLANRIKKYLKLSGVSDFTSASGIAYTNAIDTLVNEMRNHEVDVDNLSAEGMETWAIYLAKGISAASATHKNFLAQTHADSELIQNNAIKIVKAAKSIMDGIRMIGATEDTQLLAALRRNTSVSIVRKPSHAEEIEMNPVQLHRDSNPGLNVGGGQIDGKVEVAKLNDSFNPLNSPNIPTADYRGSQAGRESGPLSLAP